MKKKIFEFVKFSIIGGFMTILSLVLFFVFIEVFHINYLISNVLSYTIAVILSFYLNKIYTFKQKTKDNKYDLKSLIDYYIMKVILLLLDTGSLYLLVDVLNINVYFSKIFLTVLFLVLSFPLSRLIIVKNIGDKIEK